MTNNNKTTLSLVSILYKSKKVTHGGKCAIMCSKYHDKCYATLNASLLDTSYFNSLTTGALTHNDKYHPWYQPWYKHIHMETSELLILSSILQ